MQRPITMKRSLTGVVLACGVLMPVVGAAQAPPAERPLVAPKAEHVDPSACGPNGTHATVGQGGDVVVRKPNDQSLSTRLAQSDGVICPPGQVDPEIRAPAPEGGPMPVIPPPGSPGGNPTVQPK